MIKLPVTFEKHNSYFYPLGYDIVDEIYFSVCLCDICKKVVQVSHNMQNLGIFLCMIKLYVFFEKHNMILLSIV